MNLIMFHRLYHITICIQVICLYNGTGQLPDGCTVALIPIGYTGFDCGLSKNVTRSEYSVSDIPYGLFL